MRRSWSVTVIRATQQAQHDSTWARDVLPVCLRPCVCQLDFRDSTLCMNAVGRRPCSDMASLQELRFLLTGHISHASAHNLSSIGQLQGHSVKVSRADQACVMS